MSPTAAGISHTRAIARSLVGNSAKLATMTTAMPQPMPPQVVRLSDIVQLFFEYGRGPLTLRIAERARRKSIAYRAVFVRLRLFGARMVNTYFVSTFILQAKNPWTMPVMIPPMMGSEPTSQSASGVHQYGNDEISCVVVAHRSQKQQSFQSCRSASCRSYGKRCPVSSEL